MGSFDAMAQVNDPVKPSQVTNRTRPKKTQDLGKDDFLKLLITQLEHQDPLRPMEDREFIAQMAQFSALEQMIAMNKSMGDLKKFSMMERLNSILGKTVKVFDPKTSKEIVGTVTEVNLVFQEPRVRIGNQLFKAEDIIGILYEGKKPNSDIQIKQENSKNKGVSKP